MALVSRLDRTASDGWDCLVVDDEGMMGILVLVPT